MRREPYKAKKQPTKDAYAIPESHKELVRNRIKSARPSDYIDWEVAQKKLSTKPK